MHRTWPIMSCSGLMLFAAACGVGPGEPAPAGEPGSDPDAADDTDTDTDTEPDTDARDDCDGWTVEGPRTPQDPSARGLLGTWWVDSRVWTRESGEERWDYPRERGGTGGFEFQFAWIKPDDPLLYNAYERCSGGYIYESSLGTPMAWSEIRPRTYAIEIDQQESWTCTLTEEEPHVLRCDGEDSGVPLRVELHRY